MMYRKTTAILFLVLLLTAQSPWADVRATLSRQTIYEGDTVTLNIVTDSRKAPEPDLSVLQQDFDIVGTGSSQQLQIINGRRSEQHQWQIELAPRRTGKLSVPSIRVGSESTQALSLQVSAQAEAPVAGAGQAVFIQTEIEPAGASVYVQQQVRYTLKLFYREKLYDGSLDDPKVDNALVERLGDDSQYRTTINGMPYQVLERHYAIFPEQSGPLKISPAVFSGHLASQSRQRMPTPGMSDMVERFFANSPFTTPGKRLRVRSEAASIDVLPRPAGFSGKSWLPAGQLVLTDSWTDEAPEFRSGEPVTRTITLQARGLESTHLPELTPGDTPGMRLYPEKPVLENRTDGEWVIGTLQQTVAYVPSKPGMQTIPAIRIDWWDVTGQKQKTAELPAWTVNVLPGDELADDTPPPAAPAGVEPEQPAEEKTEQPPASSPQDRMASFKAYWPWGLAAGLLLAGVLLVARRRKPALPAETRHVSSVPGQQALKTARTALEKACQENDAAAAARALLQWAAARWPDDPPHSLGALAQQLSSGVEEIRALDKALYAAAKTPWQGDALWRVFDQGLQPRSSDKPVTREVLSPLYPDWKH